MLPKKLAAIPCAVGLDLYSGTAADWVTQDICKLKNKE